MKKLTFTIEKSADGFSAYREEPGGLIATMGNTIPELKTNAVEAYNLFQSENKGAQIVEDQVAFQYDLANFFAFYKEINASSISKRAGINKTLLSEYINHKRNPSDKQVKKIFTAVKELGKELSELEIA